MHSVGKLWTLKVENNETTISRKTHLKNEKKRTNNRKTVLGISLFHTLLNRFQ